MKTSSEVQKIELLKKICEFYKTNSLEKGFLYADTLYQISTKLNDKKSISRALSYRGIFNSSPEEGIKDLGKAVELDSVLNTPNDLSRDKINLSSLYYYIGQTQKTKKLLNEVIDFSEKKELYDLYLKATFNLTNICIREGDYNEGLIYCKKSLKHFEKSEDLDTKARIFAFIAKVYAHLENHKKSLHYAKLAQEIVNKNSIGLITQIPIYTQLSESYFNLNQEELGFKYYQESIRISRKAQSYDGHIQSLWIISAYITISNTENKTLLNEVYQNAEEIRDISNQINDMESYYSIQIILANLKYKADEFKDSQVLAQQIIDSSQSESQKVDIETLEQAYYLTEKISIQRGDYRGAYSNTINRYKIRDSLYDTKYHNQLSSFETKYQSEKKEKENLQLKADNAEQALLTQKANTRNWILALGLLALGGSAFFIYRRYKAEAKAKQIISEQKDLVETLQKELHHRMKNNLSFIDLFINLAKERFPDQAYQTKLNELQNRMRSMFEVHKQLFKKDDITSVQAKNYIDSLVDNVKQAYEKDSVTITNTTNNNEILLANISFPVGLIVNEFVTNSYKYAFNDKKDGKIDIDFNSNSHHYNLSLKDNGIGLPKDFNINNLDSFGLDTIQLLTKEYGGAFNIDGTNGVTINITLPKTAA